MATAHLFVTSAFYTVSKLMFFGGGHGRGGSRGRSGGGGCGAAALRTSPQKIGVACTSLEKNQTFSTLLTFRRFKVFSDVLDFFRTFSIVFDRL